MAQKRELGEVERSDRTILQLALSPLPDGASLVTFSDVTDRFRIEQALRDRGDALEAADKLKSDFHRKHVSYELRTPLNTILGFSEHLATGAPARTQPPPARICRRHRHRLQHPQEPGQRHS